MSAPTNRRMRPGSCPISQHQRSKKEVKPRVRSHQHLQRHQAQHQELVHPAADDDDHDTSFRSSEPVDPLDESFQPGISASSTSDFETSQDSQRRLAIETNVLQEVEAVCGEESVREASPPGCGVQKEPDSCLQGARVTAPRTQHPCQHRHSAKAC
ncbi:hypothetical protein J4Q44_G00227750 [Coregonus suidteri]|uniref:Uncharacterized protein n=1 Tax=Coregonus suidteri TaxID=861788 RepID=A0AAN8QZT5_9TELE